MNFSPNLPSGARATRGAGQECGFRKVEPVKRPDERFFSPKTRHSPPFHRRLPPAPPLAGERGAGAAPLRARRPTWPRGAGRPTLLAPTSSPPWANGGAAAHGPPMGGRRSGGGAGAWAPVLGSRAGGVRRRRAGARGGRAGMERGGAALIREGWFRETCRLWPGQAMSLQVEELLHHQRSRYQEILVFRRCGAAPGGRR